MGARDADQQEPAVNPARRRTGPLLTARPGYAGDEAGPAPGWVRIAPQRGAAVTLDPGDTLVVLDPVGEQVSDLYPVNARDIAEHFSAGRTIDYLDSPYLSVGDALYSNRSTVLARVTHDTVGVHDMTLTPCSQETFDLLYPEFEGAAHPSCFDNLRRALAPHGIPGDAIGTTLNVFMDVWTDTEARLHIDPPPTVPGDRFALAAEVALIVGVTACSAEKSNNGRCTPIDYQVIRRREG